MIYTFSLSGSMQALPHIIITTEELLISLIQYNRFGEIKDND